MKWLCRYLILGLLLALAVLWCLKCQKTIDQLQATINSPAYIDIVVDRFDEAVALQQEVAVFRGHQGKGFIACGVIGGLMVLLMLWQIFDGRRLKKKPHAPVPHIPVAAPAPDAPPRKGGYCPGCGRFYEELPPFCGKCGAKVIK